ncbi:MAG: M20/M25/M40 family metallo-hydrolase [Thermoanaerobaculia bacterium]
MKLLVRLTILCAVLAAVPLFAEERVDLGMISRIRAEGFRNSSVMELAGELVDGIGPRLTGSSNMKLANEWARGKLAGWGLQGARLESWGPFGRGWEYQESSVRMLSPDAAELTALPEAWTPGTKDAVRGAAIRVKATTKEELEKFKGKLAGRVVIFGEMPEVKPHEAAESERYDEKQLAELTRYEMPGGPPRYDREAFRKRRELRRFADKFFAEEKAVAVVSPSRRDGGALAIQSGGSWREGEAAMLPGLVMSVEHFGRIARLLERGVEVELELDVEARFLESDPMQYNTVAEIPGTDKGGEVVMLGAHLDSWHGGTGATDNAAGVAVTMEAVRILKALGVAHRRTIRIALWSGEEQGLLGSRAYVAQRFATRPEPTDPEQKKLPEGFRRKTWPITVRPEHAKLSAYFNLDNGSGKIRGIYAQENAAVVPIFESWMKPLEDLGATAVTMRTTSGTDHEAFDDVGLPGFQFIQDELEYETRTHHSSLDTYERLQKNDLMQASVVVAVFVWQAANRDGMLPRKPMLKEPKRESKPGA